MMKKTLSVILAILMIVTTIPIAFAAESGDFKYSITDEVAVITGYNGDSGALEIPATIDGYPVSVDSSAFWNNKEITSLTFYGDIVFNEYYTFKDCTNLTTVTFAGDADFNANYTFFGCTNLKNITFIGNVNTYKDNGYYYPFFESNDTHSVEVHFGGTEGEWESSADLMGHDNCPIKNATPHYCTEKDVIAKTCTEDGYQAGWYCSDCEKYVVGGEVIPASHEIETVEAQAPTCTEIGWDAYEYCTACDYTTYAEKAALDHDIVIDEAVAATCTKTGLTEGQHCSRCDDMTVAQQEIPDLGGHIDEDGDKLCDRCKEDILCKDCGRPAHGDSLGESLVCLITMLINLIVSMFE